MMDETFGSNKRYYILQETVDGNPKGSSVHSSRESVDVALNRYVDFYLKVMKATLLEQDPNKCVLQWKENIIRLDVIMSTNIIEINQ